MRKSILQEFPNYASAFAVDEVDVSEITEERFQREYVATNKPLIIRNASAHMPKLQEWSKETIAEKLAHVPDLTQKGGSLRDKISPEYAGTTLRQRFLDDSLENIDRSGTAFMDRVKRGDKITAYAIRFGTSGIEKILDDITSFEVLKDPKSTNFFLYDPMIFFYQSSYTDWHFHIADETLTVQGLGDKELLLLDPSAHNFEILWNVVKDQGFWECDPSKYPELKKLIPYRATIRRNDAIYLPIYWWHAVEATSEDFGVTLAFTFPGSKKKQFDWKFAATRWNIKAAYQERMWKSMIGLLILTAWAAFLNLFSKRNYRT